MACVLVKIVCLALVVLSVGQPAWSNQPTQPSQDEALTVCLERIEGETDKGVLDAIGSDGLVRYRVGGKSCTESLEDLCQIIVLSSRSRPAKKTRMVKHAVYLADGGFLGGALMPGADASAGAQERALWLDAGFGPPVRIPWEAAAAVRLSVVENAEARSLLEKLLANRPMGRDTLIVVRGEKVVSMPGALEDLTPQGWAFRFGRKVRKARLEAVYAVVLGATAAKTDRLPCVMHMTNGDRFSGKIESADALSVRIGAGRLGRVTIPWSMVSRVEIQSPRVVFLSDIEPSAERCTSILGLDWPMCRDTNVTGGPIVLDGRHFSRGLGVHAQSTLTFAIDGRYERFSALVGIDDSMRHRGSVVFRVMLDGEEAFVSPCLRGGDRPVRVSLDVGGSKVLTLECNGAGDLDLADHANWANALLIRDGSHRAGTP